MIEGGEGGYVNTPQGTRGLIDIPKFRVIVTTQPNPKQKAQLKLYIRTSHRTSWLMAHTLVLSLLLYWRGVVS